VPDWNHIVLLNAANVLNCAFRVTGNLADAEDVSQEVFAEAFLKWNDDPDQNWAGLLKRMSIYRAIDLLRSTKTTVSIETDFAEVKESDSGNPVELAIANEIHQRLRTAVSHLPNREAQVFCLMFFEGHSHQDISDVLDISKPAVATALSKARSKLELVFREISTGESK